MQRGKFPQSIGMLAITVLVILTSAALVTVFIPSAHAATPIYVRPGGDDTNCNGTADADYPGSGGPGLACAVQTIGQGVALVDPGGTVYVRTGTYTLPSQVNVNKAGITLDGDSQGAVIQMSGAGYGFYITANGVTVQNFELVKTDKTGEFNIIYIGANNVTAQGNKIHGQYAFGDSEVTRAFEIAYNATNLLINNNTIYALRQPGYGNDGLTGAVSNNTVYGTRGWVLAGGNLTFTGNQWGAGNTFDIVILSGVNNAYYTNIVAMSNANNGAVVEDQRVGPAVLSVVYVDDSAGPGGNGGQVQPYQTIAPAIPRVVAGGTIKVAAGTYAEQINVAKKVTIAGPNAAIPAGANPGTRVAEAIIDGGFYVSAADVKIDGVTIEHGYLSGGFKNGVAVAASNVTIEDTIIQDVSAPAQSNGIETQYNVNNLTLTNSTIKNNWRGIYLNPGSGHVFTGNLIDSNNGVGVGIGSDGQSNFTLTNNTISNHTLEGWGASSVGTGVNAHHNTFTNNGTSVAHYGGSQIDAENNYWGTMSPSGVAASVSGDVDFIPWCNSDFTVCSFTLPVHNITQGTDYLTIQSAVTAAASGDEIHVDAGTYEEAVTIDNKALIIKGASLGAIVKAPVSVPVCTTTSYDWHAVICVKNNAAVTLDTLTVDGAGRGNGNVRFFGIAFRNAGGVVKNSVIDNIQDTPFSGAQHGVGLFLYNDDATSRTLDVLNNKIEDFQKTGMAVNIGGSAVLGVNIDGNEVQGKGATTVTAQNGIQVYQAGGSLTGDVKNNTIDGIGYDNTGSLTKWVATSILNYYALVDVTGNTITGAQVGVYYFDGPGDIKNNNITVDQIGDGGMWGIVATDPPQAIPSPYGADDLQALNGHAPEAINATLVVDVSGNTVHFVGGDNSGTTGIEAAAGYGPDDIDFTANDNKVDGFEVGIGVWKCESGCSTGVFTSATANNNCLWDNDDGMYSNVDYLTVDGRFNWWGHASGPYNATLNPGGTGDEVSDHIDIFPWVVDGCGGTTMVESVLSATTNKALFCTGETTEVIIDLAHAYQLYGYQFEVSYDQSKVSATGAFVNSFFDTTTNAFVHPSWNADCTTTPGTCKFAAVKLAPGLPVSGSGDLAKITLTGVAPGTFNMAISNDVLTDIDGIALAHDLGAPLPITVCGYATISGYITMQGRPGNNVDAGTVELVEVGGPNFTPLSPATFSAGNGAYTFTNVPFMPGGTTYTITAKHGLYLDNAKTLLVNAPLTGQNTRLWGGDANNDGQVKIADLSCIGGNFGGTLPILCGATGSPDINADNVVNVQDLAIAGGNFDKCGWQPWAWNIAAPNICP